MNRTELASLAKKCRNKTALETALRSHFKTAKGKAAIAAAPPVYGGGLPRPMTFDDAVTSCLEEAQAFLPKPRGKNK